MLLAAGCLQPGDDAGDVLRPGAVGHQQRVGRVDDDEILARRWSRPAPARSGRSSWCVSSSTASPSTALPARRAARAPTATTRSRRRSSRCRSAARRPCRCAPSRHSRRRCWAPCAKAFASRRRKPRSSLALASAALGRFQDGRLQARELVEERCAPQHEDAAVPGVGAGREIALGRRLVGLLGEGVDGEGALEARAAARRGGCSRSPCAARSGVMPNSTSLPVAATSAARRTAATKPASSLMTWSDGMTTRMPSGSSRADQQRGDGNGRRGVARHRLQHDGLRRRRRPARPRP